VALEVERSQVTGGPLRVLIAKPGLDGHDRGAQIVARALRDAGMEVIYTGIRQTPEAIVAAALQEDVDCIGLSALSGALIDYAGEVIRLLEAHDASDVKVVVGGIIAPGDEELLTSAGVEAVFGPGSSMAEIVQAVWECCSGDGARRTAPSERSGRA
jgi:methylmalonyl-CoA mutase C-terminal domain/subunit